MSPPVFQSHARKYLQENVDQFLGAQFMLQCFHVGITKERTKEQEQKENKISDTPTQKKNKIKKKRPPQNKINNNNKIKKTATKKPNEEIYM